jgi:hypothetical protein
MATNESNHFPRHHPFPCSAEKRHFPAPATFQKAPRGARVKAVRRAGGA